VSWTDPFGLLPGDPYNSPGEAASDALNYINQWSIILNQEYAGVIYQDPADGQYYATPPQQGGPEGSAAWHLPYPAGKKPVGDYHTHANYTNGDYCRTNRRNDIFDSDHFSGPDLRWHPLSVPGLATWELLVVSTCSTRPARSQCLGRLSGNG
jgi:hypothetical protein